MASADRSGSLVGIAGTGGGSGNGANSLRFAIANTARTICLGLRFVSWTLNRNHVRMSPAEMSCGSASRRVGRVACTKSGRLDVPGC
jgi:hypothetical protein